MKLPRAAIAACLLAGLAGCKVAVQTKAPEAQANEVLAVLLNAGIDAEKVAGEEQSFDIAVEQSQLRVALDVLKSHGLPREHRASLGEIFRKEGLVATPAEERIRFIYGVSQELEKTIAQIDGVVSARVHVVIPANDPLADVKTPSSASVFIKHRATADPNALGPLVRSLVVRGIEGLDSEHVSVAFSLAQAPEAPAVRLESWLGVRLEPRSAPLFALWVLMPWVLLAASVFWMATRHRQAMRTEIARVKKRVDSLRGARPAAQPQTKP